jgi:hypothetical protein
LGIFAIVPTLSWIAFLGLKSGNLGVLLFDHRLREKLHLRFIFLR